MRSVARLALAILLLGLKGAGAEARYQDASAVAREHGLASPLGFNVSIDRPDREFALPGADERRGRLLKRKITPRTPPSRLTQVAQAAGPRRTTRQPAG